MTKSTSKYTISIYCGRSGQGQDPDHNDCKTQRGRSLQITNYKIQIRPLPKGGGAFLRFVRVFQFQSVSVSFSIFSVPSCIGGVDRTFACKSRECLWQDWYIYTL